MKPSNEKKWLKVIEFAVVGAATWLDPSAGGAIFILRLCFQILTALQKDQPDLIPRDVEKAKYPRLLKKLRMWPSSKTSSRGAGPRRKHPLL